MTNVSDKGFYTVDEVAELLSVHRQTVLFWISRGELIACKLGNKIYRVEKKDLDLYIEKSKG